MLLGPVTKKRDPIWHLSARLPEVTTMVPSSDSVSMATRVNYSNHQQGSKRHLAVYKHPVYIILSCLPFQYYKHWKIPTAGGLLLLMKELCSRAEAQEKPVYFSKPRGKQTLKWEKPRPAQKAVRQDTNNDDSVVGFNSFLVGDNFRQGCRVSDCHGTLIKSTVRIEGLCSVSCPVAGREKERASSLLG